MYMYMIHIYITEQEHSPRQKLQATSTNQSTTRDRRFTLKLRDAGILRTAHGLLTRIKGSLVKRPKQGSK